MIPKMSTLAAREANFDGLVGPTHHYAGHSYGNEASVRHAGKLSSPRAAALQGIAKAAALRDFGLLQGMLPPVRRPRIETLHAIGYRGSDEVMVERAYADNPRLVSALYSASSMWVANAATYSPSADTGDGKNHFTAANLSSKFHRSLEPDATASILRQLFSGPRFAHHSPLPAAFSDEGAANHGRFANSHGEAGIELFVYGGRRFGGAGQGEFPEPKRYPARQMREASEAIARAHRLDPERTVFIQQNPDAIDAGVFHNDVASVVNENIFLLHERAFADSAIVRDAIRAKWQGSRPIRFLEIPESTVTLTECVRSYLFNSQLVTLPSGRMRLIVPSECEKSPTTLDALAGLMADASDVLEGYSVFPLDESMQNGGGPACLRLRVVLNPADEADVKATAWLTPERERTLRSLVERTYRDRLSPADLADPKLYRETMEAFAALEDFFAISLE